MNQTLVVAGVAALAIIVIAIGIATSGSGSGISSRLERYASGKQDSPKVSTGQGPISDLIAQSAALAQLNKVVEGRDFGANLSRELARADLKLKVSEYLFIWAGAVVGIPILFLVLGVVFPALGSPIALLVGAFVGFFLPRLWLNRRKGGRLGAFNKQLPDTITLIANALRAGSSFLATAISIQHTVGGNLAEILDSIAFTIRERVRIKGEIRTLTAQQRLSGYVVGFLPIALVGFLFVAAPNFLKPMFEKPPEILSLPAGVIILAFGGFMMFVGFMLIRRIVDIEV